MGNQQQPSTVLSGTIPSRFCGLSVTTAGGSVTVGQLQEADLQLSTAGGDVKVLRCRAHNASINTALQPGDSIPAPAAAVAATAQTQGGSIQVGHAVCGLGCCALSQWAPALQLTRMVFLAVIH